ncbi:hypothetical protein OG216_47050 (plasmid) [Streptomycetaceae bacterium NBC_01309]
MDEIAEDTVRAMLNADRINAEPPQIPSGGILTEARRRRRARRIWLATAVTSAGVVVALGLAAVVNNSREGQSAEAQEPGYFTCGQPISWPVVGDTFDGQSLNITSAEKGAPGTPEGRPEIPLIVHFILNSTGTDPLDPSEIPPMVLILRGQVVVGGPQPTDPELQDHVLLPGYGSMMYGTPRNPWPVQSSAAAKRWLCGGITWQDVWRAPAEYEIAVVMTPLQNEYRTAMTNDFDNLSLPLIVSRMNFLDATQRTP